MRNIKEIRAEISSVRAEYEAKVASLLAEIEVVQKKRGFVSTKKIDYSGDHVPSGDTLDHNGSFRHY